MIESMHQYIQESVGDVQIVNALHFNLFKDMKKEEEPEVKAKMLQAADVNEHSMQFLMYFGMVKIIYFVVSGHNL